MQRTIVQLVISYMQLSLDHMEYDIIGDIHGQASKFDFLLSKLGYTKRGPLWVPLHGRQAVFAGDLIDRGAEQLRVIDTVRGMIDAGNAMSAMGDHTFNAIGYVTAKRDGSGQFLRKHSKTNTDQHAEFLRQVEGGSALHQGLVNWFRTLPSRLIGSEKRAIGGLPMVW